MAKIQLTIGDNVLTTEGRTATMKFTIDGSEYSYTASLVNFSFKKKMYQPTEVLAEVQLNMATDSNETTSFWKKVGRASIEEAFKDKQVKLVTLKYNQTTGQDDEDESIGDDFYVHEVRPCYKSDSMTVKLKIYSPDKQMTLKQECQAWTAKKLCDDILTDQLSNYKYPYDSNTTLKGKKDTSNMKNLLSGSQEHIVPYLVQYNEIFYDMLARTCNRWGEFLYWEDGVLNIGYGYVLQRV